MRPPQRGIRPYFKMSAKTSRRRETCRLCESARVELAVPIQASPIADAYIPQDRLGERQECFPLDLHLCLDCGHVQLLDVVDPTVLFADYIYRTSASLGLVNHFRDYADSILRVSGCPKDSLVVDIGSNDGTLLKIFKEKGLRVLGVDPAAGIAAEATTAGVPTLPAFFASPLARDIRRDHGGAAIVTANNVFAHSDALADMADGIRELLSPEGLFVFEVSYLVDIIEKLLFDTVYHEHLCYHSIKPLASFFQRHGLELIDVVRLPTKGGSIRGFVQRRDGARKQAKIVPDLLGIEARMGLDQPALYADYTSRLYAIKAELLALLQGIRSMGGTIAGYGASATVTTLIHNFELAPFLEFLADDNPARHGLFSPGHHIPVLSSQILYERKPENVLILAWQYAAPILGKNRRYIDQGGRFILPLPEVRVV
jgi:SAM-dependent methyltransferase